MQYSFGPLPDETGTLFRLWAPSQSEVRLLLENRDALPQQRKDDGVWLVHAKD